MNLRNSKIAPAYTSSSELPSWRNGSVSDSKSDGVGSIPAEGAELDYDTYMSLCHQYGLCASGILDNAESPISKITCDICPRNKRA